MSHYGFANATQVCNVSIIGRSWRTQKKNQIRFIMVPKDTILHKYHPHTLHFSVQEEDILEHSNVKCHLCTL